MDARRRRRAALQAWMAALPVRLPDQKPVIFRSTAIRRAIRKSYWPRGL